MANSKNSKYKEYLKLLARYNELGEKLRKLPNIKLAKPYQDGWEIRYDLRDDIKRRTDYRIIKEALEIGFGISYTKDVTVVRAIRKKDKQAIIKGKWSDHLISDYYPRRNCITEKQYEEYKSFNKYYELDTTSERYRRYGRKDYYCYFPSYWLVLKIKPFMITHRYIKGGAMEQEYSYLRDRLWYSGEFQSLMTNYSKTFPAYKDRTKTRSKIRKFINGDSEDIYNEKIPLEYEY